MPEILINVINKIPQLSGDVRQITADNADYTIRFVFDDDWREGEKRVYFVRENGFPYPVGQTTEDVAPVPSVNGVKLRTSLFVGVQQGSVKTSRPCMIPVYRAITDMIDDDAVQPDPSLWEDVIARLDELEKNGGNAGEGGAVYVLEDGETLDDVPEEYDLAYDPYAEDDSGGGSTPSLPGGDYYTKAEIDAKLPEAVNAALEQAKESGEFDGEPGRQGITPHIGANGNWYIGDTDTGERAQGDPGQPGAPGDDYILTEADKTEIAEIAAGLIDTALLAIIGEVE